MADTQTADEGPLNAFPPFSRDDWMRLVEASLKGAPFDRKLVSTTADGHRIEPLYGRRADAAPVVGRAPGAPWAIVQRIDIPDPAAANAQLIEDLEGGANGLSLVFAEAASARGYGLAIGSLHDLGRALDGVFLDAGVRIGLEAGARGAMAAEMLADLVEARGVDPAATDIAFGIDPVGALATSGRMEAGWDEEAKLFAATVGDIAARGFRGPFAVADARPVHDAGGSEAQELAVALATGVAYLRALEAGRMDLAAAARAIAFRLAADADQFLTLAKVRALRKLWARVESASGLSPGRAVVEAETAWRMATRRDPWVNLLRATTAAFAAGLGGANAVTVLPFTAAIGLPDAFARRLARNTQTILIEEANLARVADPAAGSGAHEALTDQLCEAAWELFQTIERKGGIVPALVAGHVQETVAAVRDRRRADVARRKEPITGTSEFPHVGELPVAVMDVARRAGEGAADDPVACRALQPMRLAEPFEALRDAADRAMAASGRRPAVFLATLGPIAAFTPRAMFAKNLYEAGGLAAASHDGFARADGTTDMDALVAAFRASGARLACLCSSDETYAREAAAAAKALAAAGARLALAGKPGELEAALRAAGVTSFLFSGMNVVDALHEAHTLAGIAA